MNSSIAARSNEALLDENYQRWLDNPRSVDADWAAFFEGFELGCARSEAETNGDSANGAAAAEPVAGFDLDFQVKVERLIQAYRALGHTMARLDPLAHQPPENPRLSLKELGFGEEDLDRPVRSRFFRDGRRMTLREMIADLADVYCDSVGAEFAHLQDQRAGEWIQNRMENRNLEQRADAALHRDILRKVYEAETFEHFLHSKYVGQKRFSLEGGEALILSLNAILEACGGSQVKEIVMGMAHRGRLNVLANFLNKPLDIIFNEFQDNFVPELVGGNGDVKYHLGYRNTRTLADGTEIQIRLAANPSHLEAVDPVVQGKARARQRVLSDSGERRKVVPLLVHGDAAFIAQGVVAEVLNMSQLPGYRTGGTIHIVVNNQIGFTTLPADARSTRYCTDIAKMIDAPIFHVNGEDPLAVLEISAVALEFRQQFGRDIVIDLYCYRRHGHNETDEPSFTQPNLYGKIKHHPLLSSTFAARAAELGTVSTEEAAAIKAAAIKELDDALAQVKADEADPKAKGEFSGSTAIFQPPYSHEPINTAITPETLEQLARALTTVPEGFRVVPKIKRTVLDRRLQMWQNGGPYDWGFAEALAFGSLLLEGTPVRVSGQDSRRGTFSHRNAVLYDEVTRERHIPLLNLGKDQARFCIYNSPLSEYAVLGFDYGYSMDFPSMLCIWEAQFGDFANGAQIIVDQFIASSESKWQRPSSIVLLLPHGYEGQGPEHSSGRLERFLQLCAEENMQVCNFTTPAQYFHALRRQIHRDSRKPLVIMTPKSLLRSEDAVSYSRDFTGSRLYEILADPTAPEPENVRRIILCSGKVFYDLHKYRLAANRTDTAILRLEQLYPLYEEKLSRLTKPYVNAEKIVWCQEEPQNMGAWTFLLPRLIGLFKKFIYYAGRPASASTAAGSLGVHKAQQERLVKDAFGV